MPDDHSYNEDAEYGDDAYDDETAGRDEYMDDVYDDDDDAYGDDEYGEDEYGDDAYGDDEYDTEYDSAYAEEDEGGSWWDEGLIGLLLVAGVILFFFPEPFTSTVGIVLIALGVVAWIADALM